MKQKVVCSEALPMEQFAECVRAVVQERAGEEGTVFVQEVRKNNGVMLTGLSIFGKGSNLSPTIYLEEFYERYAEGVGLAELAEEILSCYEERCTAKTFDAEFYTDYEQVKKRLAYRLINWEKNREMLGEIPHIRYLDLAIVFFCRIESEELGDGMIQIRNDHLRFWEKEEKQLFQDAADNMEEQYPALVCTMQELIRMLEGEKDPAADAAPGAGSEVPMYVLTNTQKMYGAAVMLYPGVLEGLSERLRSNLAILPSSVHEVIAVPVRDGQEAGEMLQMVCEINAAQVDAEEVLADSVYYYEYLAEKLTVIHSRE